MDSLTFCCSSMELSHFFGGGSSAKPVQKLPSPPPMEHMGPVQLSINSAGGHSLCAGWLKVSEQVHALMSCLSSP